MLGVNIALGNAFATACGAADADGDEEVSINELVSAVRFATEGWAGRAVRQTAACVEADHGPDWSAANRRSRR